LRGAGECRRSASPFNRAALAGAVADEGRQYLQPGGVNPLEGSYVECDGLGLVEEAGETLFESARTGDETFGREGESGRWGLYS
jgi:hypothetical protein